MVWLAARVIAVVVVLVWLAARVIAVAAVVLVLLAAVPERPAAGIAADPEG